MNTITIIALIFIFLGGVGAILLTIGQAKSSSADKAEIINNTKSENKDLKAQLEEIKIERDSLRKELESRDKRIFEQNEKIEALSNQIVQKSEFISNFVTGGNAYPILELKKAEQGQRGNEYFMFSIENNFDFPLYNIETQVFDYSQLRKILGKLSGNGIPQVNKEEYLKTIIFEDITKELPPKQFRIYEKPYSIENAELITIMRTRNGAFVQKIVLHKQNNRIYAGYSLLDYTGKLLKQHIYQPVEPEIESKIKSILNNLPNNINVTFTN